MNAQALAEQWATLEIERGVLDQRVRQAQTEFDNARSKMEAAATELMTCVGKNIPTKVFLIGDAVLIVDLRDGIKRMKIQK